MIESLTLCNITTVSVNLHYHSLINAMAALSGSGIDSLHFCKRIMKPWKGEAEFSAHMSAGNTWQTDV